LQRYRSVDVIDGEQAVEVIGALDRLTVERHEQIPIAHARA
jgi:hypothetical protein